MRKKHQAIHISTNAKKNFCKEISLSDYTYEAEIKEQLNEYFNDNLNDEDIENIDEDNNNNSDEDSFEISNIKVPKKDGNMPVEFAKFQISERAVLCPLDDYNYELIPKKTINVGVKQEEKIEENNRDIGDNIKLDDIIKQYIFWKQNCKEEDKKNSDIDPFELFNLNPENIKIIKQKIDEIKKIAKNKKMDENMLNKFLKELDDNYSEQRKDLNNLASNMEKIDSISYGNNYSVIDYKK